MHGSLLAIRELLSNAKEFMINRVKEVYENILKLKDFSNRQDKGLVRRTVILMMPKLAIFSPEMFYKYYFKSIAEYLLDILNSKEEPEKPTAFVALGNIFEVLFHLPPLHLLGSYNNIDKIHYNTLGSTKCESG